MVVIALVDVGVWLVMHARDRANASVAGDESIDLGTFEFNRVNPRDNRFYHGQFELSIHLADDLEAGRAQEVKHCQRELKRTVNATLLRQRASDFADPHLRRLKDQLQSRLNDSLGFEAIDNLAIDNFTLERAERLAPGASAPNDSRGDRAE